MSGPGWAFDKCSGRAGRPGSLGVAGSGARVGDPQRPRQPCLRRARDGRCRPSRHARGRMRTPHGPAGRGRPGLARQEGRRRPAARRPAMARLWRPCRRRCTGLHPTPFPVPLSAPLPPHPVPPLLSSYPSTSGRRSAGAAASVANWTAGARRHIWHLFPCVRKRPALHPIEELSS